MPRAEFNTTCDLIRPQNHIDYGDVYASCPCRLVSLETEVPGVQPASQRIAYITMDEQYPNEPSVSRQGMVYRTDYGDADLIAIPSGTNPRFQVLWVESIDWELQPVYVRAIVRLIDNNEVIETPCCENGIPETLYIHYVGGTLAGEETTLPYNPGINQWYAEKVCDGKTLSFAVWCEDGAIWFEMYCDEQVQASNPANLVSCDPFELDESSNEFGFCDSCCVGVIINGLSDFIDPTPTEAFMTIREIPSPLPDGIEDTFTLSQTPLTGSELLFLNGILLNSESGMDYTISGPTITMNIIPNADDVLRCSYYPA